MIPDPYLVVGPARAGTSLVTGLLSMYGLWTGPTTPPSPNNPKGFFENRAVKEVAVWRPLIDSGYHRLGQDPIPPPETKMQIDFDLRQTVHDVIVTQGYDTDVGQPWIFKDSKIVLMWHLWLDAFPKAKWIICERNDADIITSCMRTRFMSKYDTREGWQKWLDVHKQRIICMKEVIPNFTVMDTDTILRGDFSQIRDYAERENFQSKPELESFYVPRN